MVLEEKERDSSTRMVLEEKGRDSGTRMLLEEKRINSSAWMSLEEQGSKAAKQGSTGNYASDVLTQSYGRH